MNGAGTILTRASRARVPSLCSREVTRLLAKVTESLPTGTFTYCTLETSLPELCRYHRIRPHRLTNSITCVMYFNHGSVLDGWCVPTQMMRRGPRSGIGHGDGIPAVLWYRVGMGRDGLFTITWARGGSCIVREGMMAGSGKGVETVDAAGYLGAQPTGSSEGELLPEIRERVAADGRRIVVLDDDPTGVQSVHDVPVLAHWSVQELRWALSQESPTFFILTNSRAVPEDRAVEMNREICRSLVEAAEDTGTGFALTSRSDSTLRGHYPAETDALTGMLSEAWGGGIDGVILPASKKQGHRITPSMPPPQASESIPVSASVSAG